MWKIELIKRHPARRRRQLASPAWLHCSRPVIGALAVILIAAGCATSDFGAGSSERRAASLAASGAYSEAASVYIGLAANATGPNRDRLTLLAVEQWLFAGDGQRAENALREVPRPAEGDLLWLWSADAAALSLWQGDPDRALALLEPLARQPLPADHRARVEALRADAWFQKDEPLRAIDLYLQRENWLDDSIARETNLRRLWAGLRVADVRSLRDAAAVTFDPTIRGWLSLAALANATGQQGIGWDNGVVDWRQRFAEHPANLILPNLVLSEDRVLNYPRQIALLLPLSGNNQAVGAAVKNGFIGGYLSAVAGTGTDQQIQLYDVAADGGVSAAYARAVEDGAEFVVGPLIRRNVSALAEELVIPVPVLSLNYLPDDTEAPPGFFQFALAPEDEAAAAAQRAIAEGQMRAVAMVPSNDWGQRVLQSFATEYEGLGGNIVDIRSYDSGMQDFSFEIRNILAISESEQRFQRLRANIGGAIQFDPRRREDIDMIFMAADAKAGRLIKSQLKFHYAGELPVYATSFVYSMDGRSDADLEDVMFADAPWLIDPVGRIAEYPALYREYWPSERRLARLHAMGYDAYHLVGELFQANEGRMAELTGATGKLFLTRDGRVHRRLAWARFENGTPVPLPNLDGAVDTADDFDTFERRSDGGISTRWRNPGSPQ